MPKLAEKYDRYYYGYANSNVIGQGQFNNNPYTVKRKKPAANTKKVKKINFIHRFISVSFLLAIGIFVLPTAFHRYSKQLIFKSPYPNIKADYKQMVFPTANYVSNHIFNGEPSLRGAEIKKPLMTPIEENSELQGLETFLKNLASIYPSIKPTIYVWDYETGNYADINASEAYSAASIIKIPVLLQLFRSIEQNQVSLYDEMTLTEYYRSEGSGGLQFKAENSRYSIDTLARVMITDSDNSATNMIMSKIGSMTDVNQGIRDWGLSHTSVRTWLPDLQGTNYTTARDLATMLYNIENPKFLSQSSREKIFDYMGHVKNDRLIKAGLGSGASFLHKTGDIGKMLGDAGIVYTPNNKKYIVVIMANRPYNSPDGKDFIVKASEIIYNYMVR